MAVTTDDFAGKPKKASKPKPIEAEAIETSDETVEPTVEPEETPSLVQPKPEPKDGEEGYEDASNGKLRNSLPVPNPQASVTPAKKK